jgi:hypothetical protein
MSSSSSIFWFDYEGEDDFGLQALEFRFIIMRMDDDNKNPRSYKWPWFVLAAALLFVVLTVVWVSFAVKKVERERNVSAPVPAGAK